MKTILKPLSWLCLTVAYIFLGILCFVVEITCEEPPCSEM